MYPLVLRITIALVVGALYLAPQSIRAQEYSSTSFRVSNPVMAPGIYASSSSFQILSSLTQLAAGTSSASTFRLFGGFLYFPYVTTPIVSATAGNAQVSLSWTSADASVGWVVGAYEVGQSTSIGGPYSFSNVGTTLSSTRTGLTNGTPYYFVIRVLDGLGNPIATSTEVSATPSAPSAGGGGGGSGSGGSAGDRCEPGDPRGFAGGAGGGGGGGVSAFGADGGGGTGRCGAG